MRQELRALARRAVACKGWRWMPGMLTDVGERVTDPTICYLGTLPDLSDPATLGCLLALVRGAWGDETIGTAATREADGCRGWVIEAWNPLSPANEIGPFSTEVEALVAALEAADARGLERVMAWVARWVGPDDD